jgi:hypothetical protein
MTVGTVIFVVSFMSPPAICLIHAWRTLVKIGTGEIEHRWRSRLLIVGLTLASVSQLLVTAFLLTGFHSGGQSFATRVSLPWAIANWTSLLTWILTLIIVALGKGTVRRPLLIWGLVMPVTSWIVFMMGYDY